MAPDASSCCSSSGAQPIGFLESPFPSFDLANSTPSNSVGFPPASAGPSTPDPLPIFDESSGAGTSSSNSANSSSFEHSSDHPDHRVSSPDPIISIPEEDMPLTMHDLHEMDHVSRYLEFETKPSLDDTHPSHTSFCADSGSNSDIFLSRLDKVLGSDSSQDMLDKSGPMSMNDLFSDWSIPQDFCMMDEIAPWSAVDNQIECLTSSLMAKAEDVQKVPSGIPDEQECASQIFAHWLQSNSHWVSMSDLRKIKLKTSTVENATRRLGGGSKGLMLFLKFVLMWIQNSKENVLTDTGAACMSPRGLPSDATPLPGFMSAMAVSGEGVTTRDTFLSMVTSNGLVDAKPQLHPTFPFCGSSPTHASNANWNASRGRAAHSTSLLSNFSNSELRCYTPITDSSHGSLPQGSSFNQTNSSLLHHDSQVIYGICPPNLSPIFQSPTPSQQGHNWGPRNMDGTVTVPMQQQQSACSNLAATFRAARKNRMERQRWSVRHNRKWAAAANQQRHTSVSETPTGYEHLNTSSWSQSLGNGRQSFSCVSPQACQPMSRVTSPADQQQVFFMRKRQEKDLKLLFHKQLKQSDVGSLGRIVLPKKAAETCLPPLEVRDGANLVVEDMNTSKVWNMRYRFWPNNKSRMYLLENTNDFVKLNDLKEGDQMLMYQLSNRYVIRGIKATGIRSAASSGSNTELHSGEERRRSFSIEEDEEGEEIREETNLSSAITDELNTEESCIDLSFVELIEQSLEGVQ